LVYSHALISSFLAIRFRSVDKYRISWARLLKRVFDMDLSKCLDCGDSTRVIAAILLTNVIKKILSHLKLAVDPPALAPERAPQIFGD
jgi:hypothetical protein